jgi:sec-independent protein translocase protein TatC
MPKNDGSNMSFVEHLEALRWHLVRATIVWIIITIILFTQIDWIFDEIIYAPAQPDFITYDLLCKLGYKLGLGDVLCMPPIHLELLGNTVSGPFMSAISISMVGGLIVAFPYLFWELWKFIKPALSIKELNNAKGSIFWVTICFFLGAAFGYFVLSPFTFNFLANFTLGKSGAYKYLPTLDDYIDTLNNIVLGCGLSFELPVLAYVLAKIGLITAGFLKKYRKYAFVGILLLAAIITPSPDWTSQVIVALPLLVLYEISILVAARVGEKESKEWS